MLRKLSLLLIFAYSFSDSDLYAQPVAREKLLDLGVQYYNEMKLDSAIWAWEMVTVYFKPQEPEYGRAMLNLGVANEEKENYEKSKSWYKTMLVMDLNDLAPGFEENEKYASYKHTASIRLALMNAYDGDFKTALAYTKLARNTYKYQTENGADFERREVTLAKWQATYYERLGFIDSAAYTLTHKIFDSEISYRLPHLTTIGLEDFYGNITPIALTYIQQLYPNTKEFRSKIDKALKNMDIEHDGLTTYAIFKIDKFVYKLGTLEENASADFFVKLVTTSELYRRLF